MQDLTTKTLKELKAMADQSFERAYRLDIHHCGDKRVRQSWIDFLECCCKAGLFDTSDSASKSVIEEEVENLNGVERAQEPIESKLDRAVFEKLTFSQAVYACRAVSEALPAKTLREIQALWPKVADLACQPSASLFDGRSKSRWIAEIRRQLTYLLEIRAMTLAPPFGLGRSISPGCLEKSWAIPAAENLNSAERVSSAIEVQAPEPIEQVAKNIPGVKTVDCVQEPIEIQRQEPIELTSENIPGVDRVQEPIESSIPTPTFGALCDRPALGLQEVIDLLEARGFDSLAVGDRVEMGGKPFVKSRTIVRTSEDTFTFFWEGTEPESALADINATENSNGVKSVTCAIEQAIEPSKFGRIVYPKPIARTTENSNGVEIDRPWTDADRWNPADFGEVLHAAEASGQLNLLEWDVSEPPDSDDYDLITDFHAAYDLWLVREQVKEVFEKSDENNCEKAGRVSTEPAGADEIAIGTGLPSECDNRAQLHGTGGHNQDEGLGGQKGDRILEGSGADSGSAGRVLSHQPPELTASDAILDPLGDTKPQAPNIAPQAPNIAPQAPNIAPQAPNIAPQAPNIAPQAPNIAPQAPNIAPQAPNIAPQAPNIAPQATFNDERPPNRGDERPRISPSSAEPPPPAHLKPGTTVGHKSGAYLGEIEKIYFSQKRRLWRGKVGAGYYDLGNLVEQKVIPWDSPKPIGNWVDTGAMTLRCEICTIWTRKQPQTQKPTENWTLAELAALPIWQVKDIAKRCCDFIPGGHPRTKRAYIRAILAEQELRAIAIEPAQIIVRKSEPAAKVQGLGSKPPKSKGRSKKDSLGPSEPLGQQLSLNLFLTAS